MEKFKVIYLPALIGFILLGLSGCSSLAINRLSEDQYSQLISNEYKKIEKISAFVYVGDNSMNNMTIKEQEIYMVDKINEAKKSIKIIKKTNPPKEYSGFHSTLIDGLDDFNDAFILMEKSIVKILNINNSKNSEEVEEIYNKYEKLIYSGFNKIEEAERKIGNY